MFHVYWPATAALTMLVVFFTIFALLRYGGQWCNLRHHTLPTYHDRQSRGYAGEGYDQQVTIY